MSAPAVPPDRPVTESALVAPTDRWCRLTWSDRPPVAAGLYQHRDPAGPTPDRVCLVAVRLTAGGRAVAAFASGDVWGDEAPGEWAGPITASR